MKIRENIKWLWTEMNGSRFVMLSNCIVGVLYVTLAVLFVWCSKLIIDSATGCNDLDINHLLYIFVAIILGQIILSIIHTRLTNYNTIRVSNDLRHHLFQSVMNSRWSGKELFHTGDVMSRMESDVTTVATMASATLPEIVITTTQVTLSFLLLHRFDPKLAWIVLIVMPVALIISKRYFSVMRQLTHRIRSKGSEIQAFSQEHIQHRTLHKTVGDIDQSTTELVEMQGELLSEEMNRTNYSIFSNSVVRVGFMTSYVVAFVWGVKGLQDETISYGVMAAFMQLVAQIQNPTINLSKQLSLVAQSLSSIDRLAQLTTLESEEQGDDIIMGEAIGVRLQGVTFNYDDAPERAVIDRLSYNFEPCKLHAIIGESGAGKSTLIRMILALLRPKEGRVTLYDSNQEHHASPMTRNNIIYVPQGNTLSSGTIRDNLLISNPNADDEAIRRAIHIAAADFIYDLPNGLDCICGEGGAGVSEGQAQRIAIARSLLRDSRLVILDEPTAALDNQTEQLLLERLRGYARERTLIIVTHRESTVALCDTVLKLS